MKFTKEEIRSGMLLYAITDRKWLREGQRLPEVVEEVLKNGATFLQIREKQLAADAFETEGEELRKLCARYHVPCIVNDSVEVALECGADGVHVGQDDIRGRDVRAMIGPDKILGITAHTVEEAKAAEAAGADYLGVGAVFPTSTKKDTVPLTMEGLKEIVAAVDIPIVAIGGIGADNAEQLTGSGVDGVAVVSALFGAEDPGAATADMLRRAKKLVGRG